MSGRTYCTAFLLLALTLALVAPTASATADDGGDHRSLEERVNSEFFVARKDVSWLVAGAAGPDLFPACASVRTHRKYDPSGKPLEAYKDYPETPYRTCAGEVRTWDGLELDVRVSFPCRPAAILPGGTAPADPCDGVGSKPLPMVVLLHGWAGNRAGAQGTGAHAGNDPTTFLSPAWFLMNGYATLVYTARGFAASCGSADPAADVNAAGGTDVPLNAVERPEDTSDDACLEGHTHIAERGFEVKDTQHLLGRLVDAGVADPHRLAAGGESYGGGQTWLLATAMPWATPGGKVIQLAAAFASAGWTDLYGSFAPNGRATDGVDQSASHEEPFGVMRQRYVNDIYTGGRTAPFGNGRYNTTNRQERHSYFDGWMAAFNAGEPHETDEAKNLPTAFRGKSAYYPVVDPSAANPLENDYLTQLAARRVRPVPIFAAQGWTDYMFSAVQTLQMYRKLKAANPAYPIKVFLSDLGHGSQNPPEQATYLWKQVRNFFDAHLGAGTEDVAAAASFPTVCRGGAAWPVPPLNPPPPPPSHPVVGDNWDTLVRQNRLTFSSEALLETNSWSSDVVEEAASDPMSNIGRCVERPANSSASGATWRWSVEDPFTMLGLPSVTLPYKMTGEDATIVAKLWDVGLDGKKLLVTRGVYRLSPTLTDGNDGVQPVSSGQLTFKLFGNHWSFEKGHEIELELGQLDRPFFRPDNLPSSIVYDGVDLKVPKAKP